MKSYLLKAYIICFYLYEVISSLKFIDPKKIQKINRFLSFHSHDNRQVQMILNNKKGRFFQHKKKSETKFNFNYFYLSYTSILETFQNLVNKYPKLITTYTAQAKFGLPYPIGDCDSKKCVNLIVELGNREKWTPETPQIFISGTLHGDERVGPTLTAELALLMLENYNSDKWINYLLNNRRIIISPMTNSYGYYSGRREETTDSEFNYLLDPNRDFPILKPRNSCMNTITARTINEVFIHNLIKVSVSLHAGTSSFTYAYGTPNHLTQLYPQFKIPFKSGNGNSNEFTRNIINEYYNGDVDNLPFNESSESPDNFALEELATSIVYFSNQFKNFQYPIGKMNDMVYPVRGGFEDWAYSASWEGSPVITNYCSPSTYGGYDREKTNYSKNYKDAVKAVSFLLEMSNDKTPYEGDLGKKRNDCVLNIFNNPLNYKEEINSMLNNECLSNSNNGFIPKNLRLLLVTIDLLEPYVNYQIELERENDKKYIKINWVIGGAKSVDETFIIYNLKREGNDNVDTQFENYIKQMKKESFKNFSHLNSKRFTKTKLNSGPAIWSEAKRFLVFEERIEVPYHSVTFTGVVLFKVDQNLNRQMNPDPKISPQSHYTNERINPDYFAENNGYKIKGKNYFSSDIFRYKF